MRPRPAAPTDPPVPSLGPDLPVIARLARRALRRSPVSLQFGVDSPDAVVLDGLTPPLIRMVDGLDGTRSLRRVLAEAVAAGAPPAAARELLARLHRAGLLLPPGAPEHPPEGRERAAVVVHGSGRVAVAVAFRRRS